MDERPVHGDVDRRVGEHALDELEARQRLAELMSLLRPLGRQPQRALGGPDGARADHQPLLREPGPGQLIAPSDLTQHRVRGQLDVLEHELRVFVDERVHVPRDTGDANARQLLVDQKEGGRVAGLDAGQNDEEVGGVADRHEPLFPVETETTAGARGGRRHCQRVRPRLAFGDRNRVPALAADVRSQIPLALRRGARAERVGGAPDRVPERSRQPAQLLLNDDLLEHREAGTTPLGRHVDGLEAAVEHLPADRGMSLRAEPVIGLAGLLVRHDLSGQRGGPRLQLEESGGVREVHRVLLGSGSGSREVRIDRRRGERRGHRAPRRRRGRRAAG